MKSQPFPLKVYNNLVRAKVPFRTINNEEVKFYSCGPTTYDFLHVGNARALVVGDLFHRILLALGYKVKFVRNFTDVDDKIIQRAKERKIDALMHAQEFVRECQQDMDDLGMLPASYCPKVSDNISEIITMVEMLVTKNYAYVQEGDVFFHVPAFPAYGKLSKKNLEQLEHGNRVAVDTRKKHPADFVLWKSAKAENGEIAWDSPWGKGRPGWHIECSAMIKKYLGDSIDLHHGGIDLMFPHHENEIAQSEAANGQMFCGHWCHNEFLNFGTDKMSKSLGNVVTIRDFTIRYGGATLRQLLCSVHYRSRIEWSDKIIGQAMNEVERLHQFMVDLQQAAVMAANHSTPVASPSQELEEIHLAQEKIKKELANDFNVPGALGIIFGLIRRINRQYFHGIEKQTLGGELAQSLLCLMRFVQDATGLIGDDPAEVLSGLQQLKQQPMRASGKIDPLQIDELIIERKKARQEKNWQRADEIRCFFEQQGIEIKDHPDGSTSWTAELSKE